MEIDRASPRDSRRPFSSLVAVDASKRTSSQPQFGRLKLTHGGRNGSSSLWSIGGGGAGRPFVRRPGVAAPRRAALVLRGLLLAVVIFHMVMQQFGLTEGLCAAGRAAFERVMVQVDGQYGGRLVFDHPVDCVAEDATSQV